MTLSYRLAFLNNKQLQIRIEISQVLELMFRIHCFKGILKYDDYVGDQLVTSCSPWFWWFFLLIGHHIKLDIICIALLVYGPSLCSRNEKNKQTHSVFIALLTVHWNGHLQKNNNNYYNRFFFLRLVFECNPDRKTTFFYFFHHWNIIQVWKGLKGFITNPSTIIIHFIHKKTKS